MRRVRNIPARIVAVLGGVLVSMLAGLLLASYAVAGVTPSYLPNPEHHAVPIVQQPNPEPVRLTTIQRIAADVDAARPSQHKL